MARRPDPGRRRCPRRRDELLALHAAARAGVGTRRRSAATSAEQRRPRSAGSRSGSPAIERAMDPPRG